MKKGLAGVLGVPGVPVVLVALCLLIGAPAAGALGPADGDAVPDATMLRVFLKDGTSLLSYGELARVGDRVIFSMPTSAAAENLQLHLVNLGADRVDWDRTTRYADSARATQYLATQAGYDYALLSNEVAQALNDVASTVDPARRVALVEKARKTLAEWPPNHYGYRQTEVLQMLTMLDEAIADLRAAAGGDRFNLNFVIGAAPPPPTEPLLPPPTPQEAIAQVLTAARLSDDPAERTSLLTVVLHGLERDAPVLSREWALATAAAASAQIARDLDTDRSYKALTDRIMRLARARTRAADVLGLQRLRAEVERRDKALGAQRPQVAGALLDSLEAELDAARRLRLARDQYALRAQAYRRYRIAMSLSMTRFARLKPALDGIRALAGSTPGTLVTVERVARLIQRSMAKIVPPDDLRPTHALLLSAAQMAESAASIRREAALAASMPRAWDASSAAAGSLMLTARARSDMQAVVRIPQLAQ